MVKSKIFSIRFGARPAEGKDRTVSFDVIQVHCTTFGSPIISEVTVNIFISFPVTVFEKLAMAEKKKTTRVFLS